jgi:hypothetical protein
MRRDGNLDGFGWGGGGKILKGAVICRLLGGFLGCFIFLFLLHICL